MNFYRLKSAILYRLPLYIQFLLEVLVYWKRLCKFNASINTNNDCQKMQYTLLRENHIIEKGMSIRDTRQGFGQEKVKKLIARLSLYYDKYGEKDNSFIIYPLSTIKEYIRYQKKDGINISGIEKEFNSLCDKIGETAKQLSLPAGIKTEKKKNIQEAALNDFASLVYSRHSIRYFTDEPPSKELLDKALELAARTPSACNRQAWHTHIYFNEDTHELLQMQDGCKGFHDDIHCCIVVTADMKGFLGHEPFQCFIDGGLYAQNLINALHYVGLGAIPLSCGFMTIKLDQIKNTFDIPQNEAMIVIIGTGNLADETKIAISTRKPIEKTNTYHQKTH